LFKVKHETIFKRRFEKLSCSDLKKHRLPARINALFISKHFHIFFPTTHHCVQTLCLSLIEWDTELHIDTNELYTHINIKEKMNLLPFCMTKKNPIKDDYIYNNILFFFFLSDGTTKWENIFEWQHCAYIKKKKSSWEKDITNLYIWIIIIE
jgi:hypothetical protein